MNNMSIEQSLPEHHTGTRPKRSCDQCQIRRKKCDRGTPCSLCTQSGINCTYERVLKKRGPKGKVLQQIRREQAQAEAAAASTAGDTLQLTDSRESGSSHAPVNPTRTLETLYWNLTSPGHPDLELSLESLGIDNVSPPVNSTEGLSEVLSMGDVISLVSDYFTHVHPCYPFMDHKWFLERLRSGEPFRDPKGVFVTMLLALCALTMGFITDVIASDRSEAFIKRRDNVLAEVITRHYTKPLGHNSSIEQVMTTFYLALYFSLLYGDQAGHFRIAEAAQLARSMGLHSPRTYLNMGQEERIRTLALYCFIHVRNVVCELRLGFSEVVYWGQAPLLPKVADLVEWPGVDGDSRIEELWYLAVLTNVYRVVTPDFCRCARETCVIDNCHLQPLDITRFANNLESATSDITTTTFSLIRPTLTLIGEARWVEILVAREWVAAHICFMASRHDIALEDLEGGRYKRWALDILERTGGVLDTASLQSVHIQGTGLAHRLSFISSFGYAYVQGTRLDSRDLERAMNHLGRIAQVIVGWNPRHWTRCIM